MSGYTTKTSLIIYKCTANICTDSEILTYKAYTFAHQSLTSQELSELTTTKLPKKKQKGQKNFDR